MDVVDQRVDKRFAALQPQRTRTDGIAELAFNHQVDGFDHPALPKQPIQLRSDAPKEQLHANGHV